MLEDLSDESSRVLEEARTEAARLGHDFVGTEHLLLGVLDVGDATAGALLAGKGVVPEEIRAQVARAGALQRPPSDPHPLSLTARARQVLALASKEAADLGDESVAPAHLLLGIIRQGTGVAALVLRDLDVDLVALRDEVFGAMGRPDGTRAANRRREHRAERDDVAAPEHDSEAALENGGPADPPLVPPSCPRCARPLADHLVVSDMAARSPAAPQGTPSRVPRRSGRAGEAAVVVVWCGACGYPLSVTR